MKSYQDNSPLIQTENLPSLDHAPSLALADGTTWCLLVTCNGCISRHHYTDHVLVLPAEFLNGVADVPVPLETFVAVVGLGWVPGESALY